MNIFNICKPYASIDLVKIKTNTFYLSGRFREEFVGLIRQCNSCYNIILVSSLYTWRIRVRYFLRFIITRNQRQIWEGCIVLSPFGTTKCSLTKFMCPMFFDYVNWYNWYSLYLANFANYICSVFDIKFHALIQSWTKVAASTLYWLCT